MSWPWLHGVLARPPSLMNRARRRRRAAEATWTSGVTMLGSVLSLEQRVHPFQKHEPRTERLPVLFSRMRIVRMTSAV